DAVNKLKLFKDRGNVNGFLPPEDDVPAHEKLVAEHQNLDYVKQADFLTGVETETVGMVRNSLGNILRLLRPLIVLDEGHKGFSDLAHKTLYGFNPRFVLELSATPKDGKDRHANWLVDIRGDALKAEEMIKMPIELKVTPGEMWRACLAEAWEKTESLQKKADELLANENRYIRPILLVQVERTGAEQREQGFIHALDVRDQLFQLGLSEEEVAIKTSETDDLRDQDLLSPSNRIRAIITKQALQEGWDCPFAYVLCSLAVSRSTNALTQLVGRILRQPHAKRTGMVPLDKCYVFTFREDTAKIIKLIRDGLAGEGMGDLAGQVYEAGGKSDSEKQSRQRRKEMRGREFFLPKVLVRCGTDRRELDWETDILSKLDWHAFTVADQAGSVPKSTSVDGGGVVLIDFKDTTQVSRIGGSLERFDVDYGVRVLTELIPNAWIAYRVQTQFLGALGEAGWSESEIASQQSYLRTCLDRLVRTKIDDLAEKAFDAGLLDGSIVFDLVAEPWWKMPVQEQITGTRRDVYDFEKNLFDPVYENELNNLERTVACYLDRQEMVWWWYRNVVKGQGYGLQGWKRNRIYPDFIVAKGTEEGIDAWVILETKGDHLDGSDTQYKAAVGAKLASAYRSNETAEVGQLRLFKASGREYKFAIVAEGQWERDVAAQFNKPTQC
ncbi:MAG TPA: hypothetical protein VK171_06885, partial [Fimbriimonas sp.]|nr:hypothetical protein [Fimbriimonas sp.]